MTKTGQAAAFTKVGVRAAPESAAAIRREFSAWLGAHFALDPEKASDVALAVYEALANAAEFAYLTAAQPGPMHLTAGYDRASEVLTVVVADEGAWRIGDTDHQNPARGRGIPLMHALADRAVIDSSATGTEVRLQWDHIIGESADGNTDHECGSRTT